MSTLVQLTTPISRETKEMLDRHSKRTGIKKAHLIEEALRSYLIAHEQLPREVVVPATLVLSTHSGEKFARELKGRTANAALAALMTTARRATRSAAR